MLRISKRDGSVFNLQRFKPTQNANCTVYEKHKTPNRISFQSKQAYRQTGVGQWKQQQLHLKKQCHRHIVEYKQNSHIFHTPLEKAPFPAENPHCMSVSRY